MKPWILFTVVACVVLGACGVSPFGSGTAPGPKVAVQSPDDQTRRPLARPGANAASLGRSGRSPDALDTSSPQERARAQAAGTNGGTVLGETLASLGSPTEQGFWLRTGLVSRVQQGRVARAGSTDTLQVELRPSGNAPESGSQLSLAAFRALGVPLTELVSLRVVAE